MTLALSVLGFVVPQEFSCIESSVAEAVVEVRIS
jgi:hypothetical protein